MKRACGKAVRIVTTATFGLYAIAALAVSSPAAHSGPAAPLRLSSDYGKLPLAFEANRGQTDATVQFLARGSRYALFLTPTEAVLQLHGGTADARAGVERGAPDKRAAKPSAADAVVRMRLAGASSAPQLTGVDEMPGTTNYLVGRDPTQWRRDIPSYAKVKYSGVYPGIDLVYYGNDRQLEYDFIVAPGADPKRITLDFKGVDRLALDAQGNLVLRTATGTLVQHKPVVYQEIDGLRQPVEGRYVLRGKSRAAFQVARYDTARPLVIDPVLAYATYLGGPGEDWGIKLAVDDGGNAYLISNATNSFPTTPGAYRTTLAGVRDVVVSKLNPAGTALVYSTYFGGSGEDFWGGIAVDAAGNAYITGYTKSADLPVTPGAYQSTYRGGAGSNYNTFVAKLNPTGTALVYATYVGGTLGDAPNNLAIDAAGNVFVAGYTLGDFPTTPGAVQTTYGGGGDDGFLFKLNSTGTAMLYATYLGGKGNDSAYAVAVDDDGNAYVTGGADAGFPVTPGAFQTTFGGGNRDAFALKLNPSGTALVFSTYLGGSGALADWGVGIAIDAERNAYVAGYSPGPFPTTQGAYQTVHGGGVTEDVFVAKLNATGSALVYSTFIGGSDIDSAESMALDERGYVYVTGATGGHYPVTANAVRSTHTGTGQDAFVSVLNATGSALVYSTYLGTSGDDYGLGIAVDRSGNIYVTGRTAGNDFPTTPGAFQAAYGGGPYDAYVAKFTADSGLRNYQGLWWKAPAASEGGWGINFAHQGDTIFATWFTYDANGKPLWLAATLQLSAPGVYSGDVFTTTGPAFDAVPFDPHLVVETVVGTMTVTFTDANNATFAYTVNVASPLKAAVTQTKPITRQVFASPVPGCAWGAQADLATAVNYQDLWWAAPAAAESGWGINFTHQGNIIFFTWFTYGSDGKPWWLIAEAQRTAAGVYAGPISTVTGPAFSAVPWDPNQVVETIVGSTTLTFADGNHASFAYTVNGITQTKQITRQVFTPPGTLCQ